MRPDNKHTELPDRRATTIEEERAALIERRDALRARWELERDTIGTVRDRKEQIEALRMKAEELERRGDLAAVAEIRYGTIVTLQREQEEAAEQLERIQADSPLLREEVTSADIAEVVSRWTGIPVTRMLASERNKLLEMEARLHERIVGQDEAVRAISDAIRRSRAGLQDATRPIGSFIFLGTTGVGKTELARGLATFLFDDERAMIRIDMSELAEKHAVSRLIGAPPGYVGYEDGGQLTESVRRRPYSVVLLDEIEKAHPEVFNLLLQLLDEGRLTDSHGREVSFRNTIVIMTSNIGSDIVARRLSSLTSENRTDLLASLRTELLGLLRKSLRPEFLNRIDDVILFEPLLPEEIREIIDIQLQRVVVDAARQGITLGIDPEAADWLARLGYDPLQGARPLRRVIQRHVINPLSRAILAGEFSDASTALLGVDDRGKISFRTSESGQSDGPQQ